MLEIFLRRKNLLLIKRLSPVVKKYTHSNSSIVKSQPSIKALVEEDRVRSKVPFEKHFVENLFLNNFYPTVLEYPGISTLIEYQSLFQHKQLAEILMNDPEDKNVEYKDENERIVSKVKKFELCGFKLPKKWNGFGFLDSEYYFLQESICSDIPVAKVVSENEDCIQLLQTYGSEMQKQSYIEKLATGQSLACFAHLETEPLASLDPVSVTTTAMPTSDQENYIVSGKKNWVHNGSIADIIIFSANVPCESGKPKPTIFVVDKNTKGISVQKHNEYLDKFDICEVTFDNVPVPSNCVLGELYDGDNIIKKLLTSGKLNNGVQCVSIMKNLLHLTLKHCAQNKLFVKKKYERDYFKKKVGKMMSDIYMAESMTYLVAGRLDSFENPDVFLESIIVKIFASETLHSILQDTLSVIGNKIFEDENLENYIKNAVKQSQLYLGSEDTNDYLKVVLSTAGVKYYIEHYSKGKIFKKIKEKCSLKNRKTLLAKHLHFDPHYGAKELKGYVHLMLQAECSFLENLVINLQESTNLLVKKFGDNIFNQHIKLKLLADIVINIYGITATLGRASRAYCLSVQSQEVDNSICHFQVPCTYFKCMEIIKLLNKLILNERCLKSGLDVIASKNFGERHSLIANLLVRNRG